MDRDSFMDIVYEELKDDPDNIRANNIINDADEYVRDSQGKWIPCSLFMPEEKDVYLSGDKMSDEVLITIEKDGKRFVKNEYTYNGNWMWSGNKVIAWQPYPEPCQGDIVSV